MAKWTTILILFLLSSCAVEPPKKPVSVTAPVPLLVHKSLQSVVAPQGFVTLVPKDVGFVWTPPTNRPGENLVVTGYNLYYGTESRFDDDGTWTNYYPNVVHIGNDTNGTVTLLCGAVTYWFAVDAVDQDGVEGELSEEATYTTPLVMDVGFQFNQPVTNVTLQWSPNLSQWIDLGTIPTNGVWRLTGDPMVTRFYRGKATTTP